MGITRTVTIFMNLKMCVFFYLKFFCQNITIGIVGVQFVHSVSLCVIVKKYRHTVGDIIVYLHNH